MLIYTNICVYQSYIRAYILTCAYLWICVYIQNNILREKTWFFEKQIFGLKSVLKKGVPVRSSKIKHSHVRTQCRSKDLSVPCNSPNHSANIAMHITHLILYIFLKHVHICIYLSISVRMRVYVCIYCLYPKSGPVWPVRISVWIGDPPLQSGSPAIASW